jgi:hypothetical protein
MPCKFRRKHRRITIAPRMLDVTRLGSSTLLTCALDGSQNEPCDDTSAPLFSMYSKKVKEDDDNWGERHQRDAEGIVLFVSPRSCLHTPTKARQLKNER